MIARRLSPELAAMALEREAAEARADQAHSLPDPKFTVRYDEWPRASPGYAPTVTRLGTVKYEILQEFPLGGKREARREQALAESRAVAGQRAASETELVARVKSVFAEYVQTAEAVTRVRATRAMLRTIAEQTLLRYRQGIGNQVDAIQAEIELKDLEGELLRQENEHRQAGIRLNILLNRSHATPLPARGTLRRLPPAQALAIDALLERVLRANPQLQALRAKMDAADRGRDLADRSWYPDLGVGVGVVQKGGRLDSYEAMVELNIPLQWGLREAQQREASAMSGAARQRLRQTQLQLEGELAQAVRALETAIQLEGVTVRGLVPQADAAFQAALRGYESGLTEFQAVLEAGRRVHKVHIDHLKIQLDQQTRLADIERLIGGDL